MANSSRYRLLCNVNLSPVEININSDEITENAAITFNAYEGALKNLQDESTSSLTNSGDSNDSLQDPDFCPDECSQIDSPSFICPSEEDYSLLDLDIFSNSCESNLGFSANESELIESKINKENIIKKPKGNKKSNFCFFCEQYVLNFARHVTRNHSLETEVQKIISLSPKLKERRKLLNLLRNKGNFLKSDVPKPIRSATINKDLLPCKNCLDFYSTKFLWRHRKICAGDGKRSQALGQNKMLKNYRVDLKLKECVFPRMRPDQISLVAKEDALICLFGAQYIKVHREKHFETVCSRKMRELARLLIKCREFINKIVSLIDCLKPKYFDLLISATKSVAKYDIEKEYYNSPTFALNIGTSLKQCCNLAILHNLRNRNENNVLDAANAEADLKTLIGLITSQWKFEISSQATNDLNTAKWNKVTIVPLASDLKLFKEYLIKKGNNACLALEQKEICMESYIILLETIYCRVLLLNRRRPGELQRLPLHVYEKTEQEENKKYEEFSECITFSETALLKSFKRVVIRGKRGRGVPVLFSLDVQNHISTMLRYRNNFFKKTNDYFFAHPNTGAPICGYKTLNKYAKQCGAKNPSAITSTKLRKHLATLTQLFSMSDNDIKQLSQFMGHTLGVHKGSYRLPDDIYQTAKISKLLLLMENGQAGQFKGKSLNDIELDLNEDLMNDLEENNVISPDDVINPDEDINIIQDNQLSLKSKDNNDKNKIIKKRTLVPWTSEQKNVTNKFFADHIKKKKPPKRLECEELKEKYPKILQNKDWLKIKVYVQNQYKK